MSSTYQSAAFDSRTYTQVGLLADLPTKPLRRYATPIYRVKLVRDGSVQVDPFTGDQTPANLSRVLQEYLAGADREHLVVVFLDAHMRIIGLHTAHIGDLVGSFCAPREVFKSALLVNAYSIVLGHNHPSGDPTPSRNDIDRTREMVAAGNMLGIRVADHIVLGENCFVSMADRGLM